MKKLLLSLFLLTSFSAISVAQFRFKVGGNLAKQIHSNSGFIFLEGNKKVGFLLGMNYTIRSSEYFSIRAGLEFASKGEEKTINGLLVNSNFNYIEIPLDALFTFGGLYINAGPYIAFLMSARVGTFDIKEGMSPSDFGINLGLGYSFNHVGVGINYGLGISNINDFLGGDSDRNNNVVSMYLTYRL